MSLAKHPHFGSGIAVIGAFAYGFNIPAARVAALGGVTGSNLGMQRSVILLIFLLILSLVTGRSLHVMKSERGNIFAAGLCAGVTAVCYLSSLSFIPVGIAVALFYMFPLFLILLSPLTGGDKLSQQKLIAFVIAFSGIILCVGPTFDQLDFRGVALAAIAALSCAFLFIFISRSKQDGLSQIFWIQLIALPILTPIAWWTGFSTKLDIINVWPAIVISAVGFYIGFACQVVAGARVQPATLGLIFLIEPVISILSAAIFLGESMLLVQYLGISLVIAGLAYDMGRDIWRRRNAGPISA